MFGCTVNSLVASLVVFSSLSCSVIGHPTNARDLSARAVPPPADPFYNPPSGFESTAPGTILRERQVVASFFGFLPDPVETHQLLYRTTAINGTAIATATTIFKPAFAKSDRFISFQTAYDSSAVQCSPSYNYQLGSVQNDLISSAEFLLLQAYLLSGYIVASPDYEGPDAAFAPGHLEGMGALDGMRAVANYKAKLGLSTSQPAIVGVGYSGGGLATSWAASLQPSYASELNVKGWVAGGVPANLSAVVDYIDDTISSGFIPVAIAGLSKPSAYGAQLNPVIDRIITTKGRALLDFAATQCAVPNLLNFFEQSIFSTSIQTLGKTLLYEPTIASILAENVLGTKKELAPSAPVLLYHATEDEIIPYANVKELNSDWCGQGVSVDFVTYGAGGHVTTEVIGLPDALKFVDSAFKGSLGKACSSKTVHDSTLNPLALALNLEPLGAALIDVLAKAGKKDANIKSNPSVLKETV